MATRIENVFRVRTMLDTPYPNAPHFHRIFQQLMTEEMRLMNSLNTSGQQWAVNEFQLNYTPGQSDYQINVEDFGRPILVVRATTNPYVPYIPVPFDTITNLQYGTIFNYFWNSWALPMVLPETLEHIAFYRAGQNNQQIFAKIQPQPQAAVTYIITYVPGAIGEGDPLETSPALSEYQELLRLRAASALLPYTQFSEDRVADRARKIELKMGFELQLKGEDPQQKSGWEYLFNEYIRSLSIPREVIIDSWNHGS